MPRNLFGLRSFNIPICLQTPCIKYFVMIIKA